MQRRLQCDMGFNEDHAEGHAGASCDLGSHQQGRSLMLSSEHARDGKTRSPRRIQGEWVPQHLTGDIRSGIGIASAEGQGPILVHTIRNELVLTAQG